MGIKDFLKDTFWFGSSSKDLRNEPSETLEDHDIFFICRGADRESDEIEELSSWIEGELDEATVSLNDPDIKEPHMKLSLTVKTTLGEFHLVYYENDELVLRGNREILEEVKDPIAQKLDLEFKRV